jgi:hypothetical protein
MNLLKNPLRPLFACILLICSTTLPAQRMTSEMLKGDWEVKESRDIKIFGNYKLSFNKVDAHCYLKSIWTFETDSTGTIQVPVSKICPEAITLKFSYQLYEAPGYGGPMYKLGVTFDNGFKDMLYIGWDGKNKLRIAYNQVLAESSATDNRVSIGFSMKKKS